MGGRSLAVRILGIAATIRGFAYALTEGPGCLVDVSIRRPPARRADVAKVITSLIASGRPLFVAFGATKSRRGTREHLLDEVLTDVCGKRGVMILRITHNQLSALTTLSEPSKWDIADEVARHFPEIAYRLPRRPSLWEAEDDRIGLFQSVAVASAAWQMFRSPRIDDSRAPP